MKVKNVMEIKDLHLDDRSWGLHHVVYRSNLLTIQGTGKGLVLNGFVDFSIHFL